MINKGSLLCGFIIASNALTESFKSDSDTVCLYLKRESKDISRIPISTLQRMMLKSEELKELYEIMTEIIKEEFEKRGEKNDRPS